MRLASTLPSEEQAQLDIMIQLGFSTLQMRRKITRSRCCVKTTFEIQCLTAQQNPLDVQESTMIEMSDLS
uniref:HTH_Tnp_Tc3_1 domain-containing protein n=1 Tax=Caenorhabditis japonica TaxID=281687 RepID=A0A8R1IVM7_CAEJA